MGTPEAADGVAGGEAATSAPTPGLRVLLRELEVRPAKGLGQNFLTDRRVVARIADAAGLVAGATVVEVGPGYGRLLEAARRLGAPYGLWVGVDLSPNNVEHLRGRFPEERFVEGDASTVELDVEPDLIVSSLTLKHIYPSFEPALVNLASRLRPGGSAVFDVIEGERRYFEPDGRTYIRWYTRDELRDICAAAGLPDVTFDEVQHDENPNHRRLLVVARGG